MAQGYLVTLGDGNLDSGDAISGSYTSFTSDQVLGGGQWTWTGTAGGSFYSNQVETGSYVLGTDGNVYFVPSYGPVDSLSSATSTNPPNYSALDGTIDGTAGADLIDASYVDPASDQIDNGAGGGLSGNDDQIEAGAGNDTVLAGDGNDTIYGGAGGDSISGDGGDDVIYGDTSTGDAGSIVSISDANVTDTSNGYTVTAQTISGGALTTASSSNLSYHDGSFGVTGAISDSDSGVTEQIGYDKATGLSEALIIQFENDVTDASFSFQHLYTSSYAEVGHWAVYNDGVLVAEGDFTEDTSGSGTGTVGVSGVGEFDQLVLTANIQTDLTDGSDYTITDVSFTLPDIEPVGYDDSIAGGAGNDTIYGEGGNDTLYGEEGADLLSGDDGNDVLDGGLDNDTLKGGIGSDQLYGQEGDDSLLGGYDHDTLSGGAGNDTLDGGHHNDLLYGGEGNDYLRGDKENDTLYGGEGDDTLDGGVNTDVLFGEGGNDSMIGGIGVDTLDGGDGNDTLDGGANADTFIGGQGADSILAGAGDDLILAAEGDTIDAGDDSDKITLTDYNETGSSNIVIDGGEGGATDWDILNFSGLKNADGVTITSTTADGTMSGYATLLDGTVVNFSNIEQIICFTAGTLIATPCGPRMIETLEAGDLVLTRDHGPQPIRWIGQTTTPALGDLAPIRIAKGQFGASRDLLVSPQHRVLFKGAMAQCLFGESEVLVSACHMLNDQTIRRQVGGMVTYFHLLLDQHEIIFAEDAATESFFPGDQAIGALDDRVRDDLFRHAPDLRTGRSGYELTARQCLSSKEASILY